MIKHTHTLPLLFAAASLLLTACGAGSQNTAANNQASSSATVSTESKTDKPQYADSKSFKHFITREGHQLKEGDKEFRFAGIHAPELHRIENDARGKCKADPRGWGQYFQWPTADEQENWIKALAKSGHKAMRVYVLSIEHETDLACERETHILKPLTPGGMPRFNEKAMQVYDRMIALSDEHGLRLILPFIDHWHWWGGREQLAEFYGETKDDFYDINSKTYQAYLYIIDQVINRKNTITGRLYKDEKAIMAWETGNELKTTTAEFLAKTAAYIKSLDSNHLVIDGTYTKINEFALNDDNVDIISNHYYSNVGNNNPEQVLKDLKAIDGKKPYFIGEFGLLSATELGEIMNAAVNTEYNDAKAVGAFIWGFRGHRHNGGFYWHREWTGHYSYHLPGFPESDSNEEMAIVDIVRKAQADMAGLDVVPALPAPEAPKLRPIKSNGAVNWLGAPLGRHYTIERSTRADSGWQVIAKNVSDGKNEYDPAKDDLYIDTGAEAGKTYYYRVTAHNESGDSKLSNVQKVTYKK
ncbi:glycoside hydrolase 5 family protein [Saccharobesus litoralis]|uniref:cellulase family glycosylhydrolase n=1 Tax=Saccharobesus litoralis TaxID=2172099 RepID=UPI000D36290C|nr:cellulase family glycosylhydrolase [Saccharobesus litoralis]